MLLLNFVLHCRWLEREYDRSIKSGLYIDFFLKKLAESFIRNVLISGAYVFGEKYIIEYLTKLMGDRVILFFSSIYSMLVDPKPSITFSFLIFSIYMIGLILLYYTLYI